MCSKLEIFTTFIHLHQCFIYYQIVDLETLILKLIEI